MISISNDYHEATFHEKGAELASFKNKFSGIEYIWQADPAHWARHAPVLFPIVGKLKNDTYRVNDHSYVLPQHGFARDRRFELIHAESDECTFQLKWTEGSLSVYPFKFVLEISYRLSSRTLFTTYKVKNEGDSTMYFSIGAHPAFNCPHKPGKRRSDYTLVFEQFETSGKYLLENGLFSGATRMVLNNQQAMQITDSLFDEDAVVFKHLKSDHVILTDGEQEVLKFNFKGFPYLGIWSKSTHSPFVCIEPWFGLADSTQHDYEYMSKEGIQSLAPGDVFQCEYSVEILED